MRAAVLICLAIILASCTPVQTGSAGSKTTITGAAGGSTADNANTSFERCAESFGTLALLEDQEEDWYYIIIHEYRLPPTSKLLRLMAQQSNCFVVVERDRRGMRQVVAAEGDLVNAPPGGPPGEDEAVADLFDQAPQAPGRPGNAW